MVQEYVKHTVEMRLYYINNQFMQVWYTKFDKIKENFEFGDFFYMSDTHALGYTRGNQYALELAKRKAMKVSERWLKWLATQGGAIGIYEGIPVVPAIRFDFFVQYKPDNEIHPINTWEDEYDYYNNQTLVSRSHLLSEEELNAISVSELEVFVNGAVDVWTLEICEAGFSIFGSEVLKTTMMKAIVSSALKVDNHRRLLVQDTEWKTEL